MGLSLDKIEALAPDQSALAAARKLLKPAGWPTLAEDGQGLVWGECQGSGATPYRVALTEADAGYKCTCPSRKFPCKHSLALMWMRAEGVNSFAQGTPPQWVEDWLGRRRGLSATRTDRNARERASIAALSDDLPIEDDPKAVARAEAQRERTRLQREALIADGLDALDRWLLDELARGLAGFDQRAEATCAMMAKRLVDAKAGGLANRVAALPALLFGLEEAVRGHAAAQQLGTLHLIVSAYRRQEALSPALCADVRQLLGWTIARENVLADPATTKVDAHWMVLATVDTVQPDRLRRIETWLARQGEGPGERFAVLVDFVPVSVGATGNHFVPGEAIDATLAFYPSAAPLRALIAEQRSTDSRPSPWTPPEQALAQAMEAHDAALTARPWLDDWPVAARGVAIRSAGGGFYAVSGDLALPLAKRAEEQVVPLANLGAIDLFGLWDGRALMPRYAQTPIGAWQAV